MTYTEITSAAESLLELVCIIEDSNKAVATMNRVNYDSECNDRIVVICQNSRAIIFLCKSNINFFNSANIICRAMFEASAKTGWILNKELEHEKEARWIAFVKDAEKNLIKQQTEMQKFDSNQLANESQINELQSVITTVSNNILRGNPKTKIPNGLPPFDQILLDQNYEFMYVLYIELCNDTHASHLTSGNYSSEYGLNNIGIIRQWWNIFNLTYFSLLASAYSYLFDKIQDNRLLPIPNKDCEHKIADVFALFTKLADAEVALISRSKK